MCVAGGKAVTAVEACDSNAPPLRLTTGSPLPGSVMNVRRRWPPVRGATRRSPSRPIFRGSALRASLSLSRRAFMPKTKGCPRVPADPEQVTDPPVSRLALARWWPAPQPQPLIATCRPLTRLPADRARGGSAWE
jgi:hypothetical protein